MNTSKPTHVSARGAHSYKHELMQPAAAAMMLLHSIRERNDDESLKIPLDLLEKALLDLAALIDRHP